MEGLKRSQITSEITTVRLLEKLCDVIKISE